MYEEAILFNTLATLIGMTSEEAMVVLQIGFTSCAYTSFIINTSKNLKAKSKNNVLGFLISLRMLTQLAVWLLSHTFEPRLHH